MNGEIVTTQYGENNVQSVGDSFEVKGIGKVKVEPNPIQGYDYEAEGNGIIVLAERVVFTKDNIDKYNFK